jgi:hypothetical protein
MDYGVRGQLPFHPHELQRPADRLSFNEAFNLRSSRQGRPHAFFHELAWVRFMYYCTHHADSRTYPVEGVCHGAEPSAHVIAARRGGATAAAAGPGRASHPMTLGVATDNGGATEARNGVPPTSCGFIDRRLNRT